MGVNRASPVPRLWCRLCLRVLYMGQGRRRSPIPLLERGTFAMPIGLLLKRNCQRKDRFFGEWRRHDLKAQRQTSGSETHGKAHGRPAKQISGCGVSTNVSPSLAHWQIDGDSLLEKRGRDDEVYLLEQLKSVGRG